jgi:hypothetical protein
MYRYYNDYRYCKKEKNDLMIEFHKVIEEIKLLNVEKQV